MRRSVGTTCAGDSMPRQSKLSGDAPLRSGHTAAPMPAEQLPIWIRRSGKCLRIRRALSIM